MRFQLQRSCSWISLPTYTPRPLYIHSLSRSVKLHRHCIHSPHFRFVYLSCSRVEKVVIATIADQIDTTRDSGFCCACSRSDHLPAPDETLPQNSGFNCKIPLRWVAFYFMCRAVIDRIRPIIGMMIRPLIPSSNFMINIPLACISDPTKRPVPLQLDLTIPSLQDLKWSFSRLYYLFNVQLERNIGMSFIVLLLACFSFVVLGGLIFYNFRHFMLDS